MTFRRVSALAAALLVLTGGVASAAKPKPKPPPCKTIQDPAGDVASGDQSLDVTSADVVSDGRLVTTVIRVKQLGADDPMAPTGRFYEFAWSYDGAGYSTKALITPTGNTFYGVAEPAVKGVVDIAHSEIRVTVNVDNFPGHPVYRKGGLISNVIIRTDVSTPAYPLPMSFVFLGDTGTGTKAYAIGTPSCAKLNA